MHGYGNSLTTHPIAATPLLTACILVIFPAGCTLKTTPMLSNIAISRFIILGFMGLVGFSLAKSISAGSAVGLILAITSLAAGIYFLYLLLKANESREEEKVA